MELFTRDLVSSYKALLFDLDGTLVDSMPAHNKAWQKALSQYQVSVTDEELYQLAGIPNHKTAELFIDRFGINADPANIVAIKEDFFASSLPHLQRVECVTSIVTEFYKHLPLGVVSGSPRQRIDESLRATKLETYFDCIISCEDTALGKPAPDPYLLGAQRLGVLPTNCLVFEDGSAGIQSAESAKMKVIYVKSPALYEWSRG